jgi:hypothetical protein
LPFEEPRSYPQRRTRTPTPQRAATSSRFAHVTLDRVRSVKLSWGKIGICCDSDKETRGLREQHAEIGCIARLQINYFSFGVLEDKESSYRVRGPPYCDPHCISARRSSGHAYDSRILLARIAGIKEERAEQPGHADNIDEILKSLQVTGAIP